MSVGEIKKMAIKSLIKNAQKYRGEFVATSTFNDRIVIAHGQDPQEVMKNAEEKSDAPVIFFVPERDATHIY